MIGETTHDPARRRFFAIQAVRLAGVAMVVLGMLIASRQTGWPTWPGYLLLVIGLVDVFVIPVKLARRWRTPR
jgi:membrane protein YdbS with pleckstrin-like domain